MQLTVNLWPVHSVNIFSFTFWGYFVPVLRVASAYQAQVTWKDKAERERDGRRGQLSSYSAFQTLALADLWELRG